MSLLVDKLTGNIYLFDIPTSSGGTGSGGTTPYPQVNVFAGLPSAAAHSGEIYVVLLSTGIYVVNRKEAGLYYSNGSTWTRLGDIPSFFNDDNFQVFDGSDNTKRVRFQLSGLTSSSLRTITMRNTDGTLAYLSDITGKLDASVFNLYTGTTAPATYLTKTAFNIYSGTTVPATYVSKLVFNSYTASTAPVVSSAVTGGTSLGGSPIFAGKVGRNLTFKGLVAGSNITLTPTSTGITISASGSGSGGAFLPLSGGTMQAPIKFRVPDGLGGYENAASIGINQSDLNKFTVSGKSVISIDAPSIQLVNASSSAYTGTILSIGKDGYINYVTLSNEDKVWQDTTPNATNITGTSEVTIFNVTVDETFYKGYVSFLVKGNLPWWRNVILRAKVNGVTKYQETYTNQGNYEFAFSAPLQSGNTINSGDTFTLTIQSDVPNYTVSGDYLRVVKYGLTAGITWGNIGGDMNNQIDLTNKFNTKLDISAFTGYSATTNNRITELEEIVSGLTGGSSVVYSSIQVIDLVGGINVNNIAQTSIQWTNVEFTGSSLNYTGASRIYIQTTGNYEISYNLVLKNSNNVSKTVGSLIRLNGTTNITPLSVATYIDNGSSITGSNNIANYKRTFTAGDYVELQAFRIGANGAVNTVPGASWIKIIKTT